MYGLSEKQWQALGKLQELVNTFNDLFAFRKIVPFGECPSANHFFFWISWGESEGLLTWGEYQEISDAVERANW